ncbi:MAG: DUF1080 domain-containing protein [Verrucomicrobiales bacterium]|nr:DUF1080 domain-containing protein [Verrucomicrobiales bacterium]
MKNFLTVFILTAFAALSAQAGHPEKDAEGFVTIFDGTDMEMLETEGNWQIDGDGSLYLEPREGEEGWKRYHHYLWLKKKYGDFVFDFEYKYNEGGNSGFYFRVGDRTDPVESGFEVQILDSSGKSDEEMGHHDNGGVIKTQGASKNMTIPAGEWNRMTVTVQGDHLTVILNGEKVQDLDLAAKKPKEKALHEEGYITIQDHGLPFWVRDLRVKAL